MLKAEGLRYRYPDGHEALHDVSLAVHAGEKLALAGANGSGKSTLLLLLAGALPIQDGSIALHGKAGLTFQDADDELLMPTVLEDVAFSLVAGGMSTQKAHERARGLLAELGISHLAERPPHRLSGGEKRMVSFAGVLAASPDLLLLDEPSAGLDPRARRRVIDFLRGTDKTIILATHDLDMALDVCTRALILNEGAVSAEGVLPGLFTDAEKLEALGLELPLRFWR